jgi:RNase P/RNase MRP subunit POP5
LTVKDKVGRIRWIGFLLDSSRRVNREELSRSLAEASRMTGTGAIQLTVFDGRRGIVRVSHRVHRPVISLLGAIKSVGGSTVGIRTVISSGMIGKVKDFMDIPKMKPEERRYIQKQRKRANSPSKGPGRH